MDRRQQADKQHFFGKERRESLPLVGFSKYGGGHGASRETKASVSEEGLRVSLPRYDRRIGALI